MESEQKCPECGGDTIVFRGVGREGEYWICPRREEPGHLGEEEVLAAYAAEVRRRSGGKRRFA